MSPVVSHSKPHAFWNPGTNQGVLWFPIIKKNIYIYFFIENLLARVHPDALCLKPRLVDALRGADQQSVQWCRRSRSSGPSGRYVPGQQRKQHQQPLYGRLWWTSVTGRTVFERLPEWPIGLKLEERLKTNAGNVAVQQHIPKHWPEPVTLHSEENIPEEVYHTEYNSSLAEDVWVVCSCFAIFIPTILFFVCFSQYLTLKVL